MKIFNGKNFVDVDASKGISVKAFHDHDMVELVDGTWIKSMRDGRYYDEKENLWVESYSVVDVENEEFELSGLFYQVGY